MDCAQAPAEEAEYRGQPTAIDVTLALTFSGNMMVELIQQHNDVPSVYREAIERRGHGFHHWAVVSQNFDAYGADMARRGYELVFTDTLPDTRVAYYDTSRDLAGMIEVIAWSPALERRHTLVYAATLGWDGTDPIRRI